MSSSNGGIMRIDENLYIDFTLARICTYEDGWKAVMLNRIPFAALRCLAEKPGKPVHYDTLIEQIWECSPDSMNYSQVRKQILHLRNTIKILVPQVDTEQLIQTQRGYNSYLLSDKYIRRFSDLDEVVRVLSLGISALDEKAVESAEDAPLSDMDREYARARQYEVNNLFDESLNIHLELAKRKYAPSINYLGVLYTRGEYVKQDVALGIEKYREAAELNYATAQMNMGDYHMNKLLGCYNPQEAVRLYRLAALNPIQSDEDAMFRLYLCYQYGMGVKADAKEAEYWRTMAQKRGVTKYINYYQVGMTALGSHPLVTGDSLLRLRPHIISYALLNLETGHEWLMKEGFHLVGNSSACYFNLSTTDARHALIHVQPNVPLTVIDLNSDGGTFINDQRIPPLEERTLQDGDQLRFAQKAFMILRRSFA